MKTLNFTRLLSLVMLLALSSPALAASHPEAAAAKTDAATAMRLEQRLEAIRDMDKSSLSKEEKKALRKEVKETKKQLAAMSGGVYLSVGAVLLIALLLILLL
jgi:hypothetical protein